MNQFGWGFLCFGVGFLVWSIGQAGAYPQGPSVDLGSNPIWSYAGACTSVSYTVPAGQDLIVTDIMKTGGSTGYITRLQIDGTTFFSSYAYDLLSYNTGFKIPSGSVISCTQDSGSHTVTISGYFVHS